MLCQHTTVQIIGGNKWNKQTSWELLLLFTNFKNEHGRSGPNFSRSGHEKIKYLFYTINLSILKFLIQQIASHAPFISKILLPI